MYLKFIFCIGFLLGSTSIAQVIIGNGGDGIIWKDKIILRDLFEQNSYENPYIGSEINEAIQDDFISRGLHRLFREEKNILLVKLSHLNSIRPGLGFFLMAALSKYSFKWTMAELEKTPDEKWDDLTNPRQQLAIRRYYTITISYPNWQKMDSVQKAALLIHEAVYSLMQVECPQKNEYCYQKSEPVRFLVGQFFLKQPTKNINELLKNLNIQDQNICEKEKIKTDFYLLTNSVEWTHESIRAEDLKQAYFQACVKRDLLLPQSDLLINSQRKVFTITRQIYFTEFGTQVGLHITPQQVISKKIIPINLLSECKDWVLDLFNSFILLKDVSLIDPMVSCN